MDFSQLFDYDIRLECARCVLERLQPGEEALLQGPAAYEALWRNTPFAAHTDELFHQWVKRVNTGYSQKQRYTMVVWDKASGKPVGSMSYGNPSYRDLRLEIGWSWLSPPNQGTGLNKWAKFMLIDFGFTHLGLQRIEFKTDEMNIRARKALIKLGCLEEGILRSHTLMHDGRRRNTIYYSILARDWPTHKNRLFTTMTYKVFTTPLFGDEAP